jgi:hypothetical protein
LSFSAGVIHVTTGMGEFNYRVVKVRHTSDPLPEPLQLLVVAAIAATWARARWGGRQVWIVGVPVLLAGLWGTVEAMAMALPNLS